MNVFNLNLDAADETGEDIVKHCADCTTDRMPNFLILSLFYLPRFIFL